jgi:hypothetical protein
MRKFTVTFEFGSRKKSFEVKATNQVDAKQLATSEAFKHFTPNEPAWKLAKVKLISIKRK